MDSSGTSTENLGAQVRELELRLLALCKARNIAKAELDLVNAEAAVQRSTLQDSEQPREPWSTAQHEAWLK